MRWGPGLRITIFCFWCLESGRWAHLDTSSNTAIVWIFWYHFQFRVRSGSSKKDVVVPNFWPPSRSSGLRFPRFDDMNSHEWYILPVNWKLWVSINSIQGSSCLMNPGWAFWRRELTIFLVNSIFSSRAISNTLGSLCPIVSLARVQYSFTNLKEYTLWGFPHSFVPILTLPNILY